jgi:tRNA(Ile)-lysidine synthase
MMEFSPDALYAVLARVPARRFLLACSGGLDSTVLLHALAALRGRLAPAEIIAVHVDHGLHAQSSAWSAHCARACDALGLPCMRLSVAARPARGVSPEDAARRARYAALAAQLVPDDVLLTAHHQDDQAETLLLQLLRGSGPRGLAAMPVRSELGAGVLLRPLLDFERADLQRYARAHKLTWIEDHSNADTGFDRNYLRHEVMPRLLARWPAMARTLSRSARHCAEAAALIREVAADDLHAVRDPEGNNLDLRGLTRLSVERQRQVLRAWIEVSGLPLPDSRQLAHIFTDVIATGMDATPVQRWPGVELRRYRERLYLMPPLVVHDSRGVYPWSLDSPLDIPGIGVLRAQAVMGEGLSSRTLRQGAITVRFRRGGERVKPARRSHTHALKHLLQEAGVPPWQRDRVPLIYCGEVIAAVVGLCVCEGFQAGADETAMHLYWQ